MAVSKQDGSRDLLVKALDLITVPLPRLRMAEMGDQRFRIWFRAHKLFDTLKRMMEFLGVYHISIDQTGKWGSLPLDLAKPLRDQDFPAGDFETFDLVTNFGTIEHVYDSQAVAFANMHDLCRTGGLIVHAVPHEGERHGDWQYNEDWFRRLAESQQYEILQLYTTDPNQCWDQLGYEETPTYKRVSISMVMCILKKTTNAKFRHDLWTDPVRSSKRGRQWR